MRTTVEMVTIFVCACCIPVFAGQSSSGSSRPERDELLFEERYGGSGGDLLVDPKVGYGAEDYYSNVRSAYGATSGQFSSKGVRGRQQRVVVIPVSPVDGGKVREVTEDLKIMSHILNKALDDSLVESGSVGRMFANLGVLLSDDRTTEGIWLEGYGVLFLMNVEFPLLGNQGLEGDDYADEPKEPVDTVWDAAMREMLHPRDDLFKNAARQEGYDASAIERIKGELVKTLKHAANIRILAPEDSIILTLSSESGQFDLLAETMTRSRTRGSSRGSGYGGSVGVGGEFMSSAGRSEPSSITIRAKKSQVDSFAKGEMDFEQFRSSIQILTY